MTTRDDQIAMVAPSFHVIRESVIGPQHQLVRCRCGRSGMFSREVNALGHGVPHKLAEFTCDGDTIVLRRAALRPL